MTDNKHRNRLALTYLSIIMVLSIGFSFGFYREASHAANAGFDRQTVQLRNNLYFTTPSSLNLIRDKGKESFNDEVFKKLVLLNLAMLLGGGLLSVYLAKKSLEPLEEALEKQSRFTTDAAHELRTPLTAMKTETEIVLRAKKISLSDTKDALKSNLEEIDKLQSLTDSLLSLAKTSSDKNTELKDVKITEVIEEAAKKVLPLAKNRSIEFELPAASKVTVRGNSSQLREMFVTLLDNAVKYGRDNTAVSVVALKNDDSVVIKITDEGIGISKKDLPHIFERFYRADQSRTKVKTEGYGLGLSVAEAIIKAHSGSIKAESELNKGTIFTVCLPRN